MSFLEAVRRLVSAPPADEAKDDLERAFAVARVRVEFLLALLLVAVAVAAIALMARTAARPKAAAVAATPAADFGRVLALASDPGSRGATIAVLVLVLLVVPVLPVVLVHQARARFAEPAPPDPTRRPPAWGVLFFFLAYALTPICQYALGRPARAARLVVEEGSTRGAELELESGSRVLLAHAGAPKPARGHVIPVAAATSVRARIERGAAKTVLVEEPALGRAPRAFVGSEPIAGPRRLKHGDRIRMDEVLVRLDEPESAFDVRPVLSNLVLATLVGAALAVVLVLVRGGTLAELGLVSDGAPREVLRGMGLVAIALPWLYGLAFCNGLLVKACGLEPAPHVLIEEIFSASPTAIAAIFVAACVAAPIQEELLFRGVLLRALRRPFGLAGALGVSALFFGALHPLATVLPVGALGAWLGWITLTARRGSLLGSIAGHAFFNAQSVLFTYLLSRALG